MVALKEPMGKYAAHWEENEARTLLFLNFHLISKEQLLARCICQNQLPTVGRITDYSSSRLEGAVTRIGHLARLKGHNAISVVDNKIPIVLALMGDHGQKVIIPTIIIWGEDSRRYCIFSITEMERFIFHILASKSVADH